MTVDYGWQEVEPFTQDQAPTGEAHKPVHVKVTNTQSQTVAPEFTALTSAVVPEAGTAQPVQICPHKYHRYKTRFVVTMSANTTLYLAVTPDPLSGPVIPPTVWNVTQSEEAYVATLPDYEGQQPLYAVYTGNGPVSISVMDMTYGPVI